MSTAVIDQTTEAPADKGKISDGYHTFDELYDHRITLWIAVCRLVRNDPQYQYRDVWRTQLHSDGSRFDGWFVLGMTNEKGQQLTYHLPESRWEECSFATAREKAPEFDGHTSADVLERIKSL